MTEHLMSERGLEAWRQLDIGENEPLLVSGASFIWLPHGKVKATNKRCGKNHEAPNKECACGIYAFKTMEDLLTEGRTYIDQRMCVVVKLYLSGRVLRYTKGYRAQFAKIAEIVVMYRDEKDEFEAMYTSTQLGEAYQVPSTIRLLPEPEPTEAQQTPSLRLSLNDYLAIALGSDVEPRLRKAARSIALQKCSMKAGHLEKKRIPMLEREIQKAKGELQLVRSIRETLKKENK